MGSLKEQKTLIRESLKAARAILSPAQREACDSKILKCLAELTQVSDASVIFSFVSLPGEVDTHKFILSCLENDQTLLVPKITTSKTMAAVELHEWEELKPGELGIMSPTSSLPYEGEVTICITPGLGFTESGQRIGFGLGYYDRWFKENPNTYRIALAYECQIVDELPTDENDIKVDMIITEKRIIKI